MTWYGASLLFAAKLSEGNQDKFPVSEEVYLINAPDDETAWRSAEEIGHKDARINGSIELDSKSAKRQFLGIRKLRSIYNPATMDDIDQNAPTHGSEITRSHFEIVGQSALDDLRNGLPVTMLYLDGAT